MSFGEAWGQLLQPHPERYTSPGWLLLAGAIMAIWLIRQLTK